jgi:hypothetical protein
MFRMEQSGQTYELKLKRFGSDIPRIDKHIQTDIVIGSNEIKK